MTGIRVTYSGLISFAVSLLSILTGVIFTLVVTRQLTQDEFGAWGLIGTMTGYVLIFGPITTYWVTREIARGENDITDSYTHIRANETYLQIVCNHMNEY